jgi:hypothetical protein
VTRRLLLALTLAGVAALSACGKDPSSPADGATSTPPAGTGSSPASSPTAPKSTLPPGVDQLVAVTVKDGKVTGDTGRVDVEQGSKVQIRVTSDVSDEVHLHGYDKSVDVKAGHTARLTFTANIPGVFEVELESRAKRLTQLQVQ